jgi:hypothetical protein
LIVADGEDAFFADGNSGCARARRVKSDEISVEKNEICPEHWVTFRGNKES